MSAYGRGDPWGVPLEDTQSPSSQAAASAVEDECGRYVHDLDPAALSMPSPGDVSETSHSWLLDAMENGRRRHARRERYVDLGCLIVRRKVFFWVVGVLLACGAVAGLVALVSRVLPRHYPPAPVPDNYTLALHKALMFFNAQRSGPLPKSNNVTWRGNSGLKDGGTTDLVGGFYDAGGATKFTFPASFAITMLSWSVIEYGPKYESMGELDHIKEIIKWGADYFLKTFNSSSHDVDNLVWQVGSLNPADKDSNDNCWMRPEDIDYPRVAYRCHVCSDLAAEMAAALAATSIVFKDSITYSEKLVHGAEALWKFARTSPGRHSTQPESAGLYNSSRYLDEFIWAGAWLYYATGNKIYLSSLETDYNSKKFSHAFGNDPGYRVLSWDKKLAGAQVLLSRLRLFLSPGYPYEQILKRLHKQANIVMCSYLPFFTSSARTKGGLILFEDEKQKPLQYAVNAAFLASLYSDYLDASGIPGWYCGPNFYSINTLSSFARAQVNYILGKNPLKISYLVGFGDNYPKHIHHRGASVPKDMKSSCSGGWKWRDNRKDNPNVIIGAMVSGPDKHDGFQDDRKNPNYTEPSLAGNAGLVAALVSLSTETGALDKNAMFSSVPPMFPVSPPPPSPWKP